MYFMPNRNAPRPPRREIILDALTSNPPVFSVAVTQHFDLFPLHYLYSIPDPNSVCNIFSQSYGAFYKYRWKKLQRYAIIQTAKFAKSGCFLKNGTSFACRKDVRFSGRGGAECGPGFIFGETKNTGSAGFFGDRKSVV